MKSKLLRFAFFLCWHQHRLKSHQLQRLSLVRKASVLRGNLCQSSLIALQAKDWSNKPHLKQVPIGFAIEPQAKQSNSSIRESCQVGILY
ncbi:uncharacterized protein L203_106030 [Cryptococcus depauperatus CBS 7841]|uniref:Uncharacterized protein n=1 Tax=Cryptococcus depauperatus CBS 7841 TaxID=1295531 RepID=A0AAJ8JYF1_9TREE